MADAYPEDSRPRRKRRRLPIVLLVLLVLLLVGLTVADRAGAAFAEREIARRVSAEVRDQRLQASPPEVTVKGVPFLTQVAAGDYQEIRILLRDVSGVAVGDRTVRLSSVDVQAHDVQAPLEVVRGGSGDIVARRVNATATIDYASLAGLTGREGVLLAERGGRLAVTAPLDVMGRRLTLAGTADVAVEGGAIRIRFQELTAADLPNLPLVQNLITGYARQLSLSLDLPTLPLNLTIREVRVRPEGLVLLADATDVPLNRAARPGP